MAQSVLDHRPETRVYSPLPGAGGDTLGHQPDCQKSRTQTLSQVNAQQVHDPCSFSGCYSTPSHPFFCSCSFWGRFGERINKPTTVTVKDPSHLFSLLSDAALDVSTLRLCTNDILEAVYTSVHDNAVKGTKTDIFVAAFTTCHARLKLYESLDTPGTSALLRDGQCSLQVASRSTFDRHGRFSGVHDR